MTGVDLVDGAAGIIKTLKESDSVDEAAEALGISRHQLRRKVKKPSEYLRKPDRKQAFVERLERRERNCEESKAARTELLLEKLETFTSRVFKGRLSPVKIPPAPKRERTVFLVLSDLHFGSDLRADETGVAEYGPIEESRRLAAVVEQARGYKLDHRKDTDLEVLLLGDVIQNQLHDPRDGAVLAEQCCRAIHLLMQAVGRLAEAYGRVRVHCVTGNHGRNVARHLSRATFQKFDSHESVIYYAIKSSCERLSNVEFFIPKKPYVTLDVFGKKLFATHGDTVLNPGNPGKAIKVASLESQINRINAALRDREEYAVAVVGHVHTPSLTHLGNGTIMITNGALLPADNFCVSLGILETAAGQWLFEAVPGFPVGDARLVQLDSSHDCNAKLDRIIKPWKGL